jgi:ParB/RepB/Spo0J family partition protein
VANELPAGIAAVRLAPKPRVTHTLTLDLPLALLLEPLNPMRHHMDNEALIELQDDIRAHGLHQNLCVIPVLPGEAEVWARVEMPDYDAHIGRGGRFRVAAGHRRFLACRAVNWNPVRCNIFADIGVSEETIMAGENTHREDPSDYDLAVMYSEWIKEPGLTEVALCKRAGKSPNFVYDRIALLEGYKEVADALHARKITCSVAKAINRCDEAEYAMHFLAMAIDQGATTKLVNAWVNERKAVKDMSGPAGPQAARPATPIAPAFQTIECILCGDTQSYNLQTVCICGGCRERVNVARSQAEAAEQGAPDHAG